MPPSDRTPATGARAAALAKHARTAWRLLLDPRVPIGLKAIPMLAALYAISPIDLASELLVAGLGPLVVVDDFVVVMLALRLFIWLAPDEAVAEAEGGPVGPVIDAPYRIDDGP
jgi:uncharacterized membrane protein YkvA (DUF1232 family)